MCSSVEYSPRLPIDIGDIRKIAVDRRKSYRTLPKKKLENEESPACKSETSKCCQELHGIFILANFKDKSLTCINQVSRHCLDLSVCLDLIY